ncbi:Hypothetical predicted protein [Paramuricea clavata]|uniref:Uncharacterized protein n=1 Tax=Paramuricea clavata TaxID=317549 RepID=A0A7D9LNI0_PARCT|nr:Hypothetical predicted protein [Paramuricea clavata]
MKNSVTVAVIKVARSTRNAEERITTKTTPLAAKHTKIKIFFFVTRLYEYGCSIAMYLSNVIPNNISVDIPSVIRDNPYARPATKQFESPLTSPERLARNEGIPKTPTAKSAADCIRMIK